MTDDTIVGTWIVDYFKSGEELIIQDGKYIPEEIDINYYSLQAAWIFEADRTWHIAPPQGYLDYVENLRKELEGELDVEENIEKSLELFWAESIGALYDEVGSWTETGVDNNGGINFELLLYDELELFKLKDGTLISDEDGDVIHFKRVD